VRLRCRDEALARGGRDGLTADDRLCPGWRLGSAERRRSQSWPRSTSTGDDAPNRRCRHSNLRRVNLIERSESRARAKRSPPRAPRSAARSVHALHCAPHLHNPSRWRARSRTLLSPRSERAAEPASGEFARCRRNPSAAPACLSPRYSCRRRRRTWVRSRFTISGGTLRTAGPREAILLAAPVQHAELPIRTVDPAPAPDGGGARECRRRRLRAVLIAGGVYRRHRRCLQRGQRERLLLSLGSPYLFMAGDWTTAMPYGLLPVATVAVTLKVLGSMTDSVFAPWSAT
jgi:hypothetical protein